MRFRFLLGLAAVAAIAIGSVLGAVVVRSHETRAFERRQSDEALRAARQAEALATLSVGQLASAAAFYEVEGTFTQHEFEAMANSLLASGGLSGTGLVQEVLGPRRAQFERSHGYPIVERAGIGFRRAPRRARYYPLTFAASASRLEPPLGYDLGADPARSSVLLRAGESGEPAATRVMHLPIGGTGINVFRPVYRDGAPTATVAQRRAALIGFAVGAFHVPDLTAAATSALADDVDVQLTEEGRTVAGRPLPRSETAAANLRIADRTWRLAVLDPNRPDVSLPVLIAVFGISMAALLGALVLIWSRNERMQELALQASQDPLTGLKNRRRFGEDLRTELARSRREETVGAVLMLDLDNFKQVNDTLGHPTGDRVIADIAGLLSTRMRITDVVARLGGDEFAIVLPRCELDEAEEVAEAIGNAIRLHTPPGEAAPPITASIGVATFGPGTESDDSVLSAADNALYEAKRAGRDAVRVAGQTVAATAHPGRDST
jgi:diguanylate cyclase (GGDEF)-like protein